MAGARDPYNPECFTTEPATLYKNGLSIEGQNETCATYNMLKLTRKLLLFDPRVDRVDYYERGIYNHILASVAEGVRAIKVAVAELTESNHVFRQRIDDSIARLNTLIKETQKRKVAQQKPAARPTPLPAKTPPFHVDAIDVWDDMTYVAISQAGRVAFLKSGAKQSGWTVARIDRLKGRVEFKGPHGQNHSVSLQR